MSSMRSLLTAVSSLALAATVSASGARAETASPQKVQLTINDKGCDPMTLTVPPEKIAFQIKNASHRGVEWEILKDHRVLHERENILPGFTSTLTTKLDPGTYGMTCGHDSNPRGKLVVSAAAKAEAPPKAKSVIAAGDPATGEPATSFLGGLRRQTTLTSTVPGNGDQNPYAIYVAPVSAGKIHKDDVLVDNFNDKANLQGLGTTIVDYNPATKKMTEFAAIPKKLDGCPGGVGLTTAMAMLKTGWVIVGSLPSTDGTTATKGKGCLVVLDPDGKVAGTITSSNINGPWGNMAVIDDGAKATLFVSNTGFDVGAPTENSPVVKKASVVRIELSIANGKPPVLAKETVIGSGFGEQADKGVFIIGPTGLALGKDGVLYVSDALDNSIAAIPNAATREDSAGIGRTVTQGDKLQRPLALTLAPNGHLLAVNGLNGQVVEVDPASGKQIEAYWANVDKAQQPPGSGDLFGIAMTPSGDGIYYVQDDVNTLTKAN